MCTNSIKRRTCFFFIEEAYFCCRARPMQVIFYFSMTQSFTFLFLWQTLTSSTSTDTEFSSFSEFCNGFSDTLNKSKLLNGYYLYALERAYKKIWNLNVGLPVLWKNPVKVSCRFEAILQDKRLELKPQHAFDPISQVQKTSHKILE